MSTVLGLDLGPNSIGWALCDEEQGKIVDCGVRVFEEGVNHMNQKREESKNAERRDHRQTRKRLRRLKGRKYLAKKFLQNIGLLPKDNLIEVFKSNPYELRRKGIHEKLELYEIGRVFYHLNKRRGYKSNRKEKLSGKDEGAIFEGTKEGKPGINEVRDVIKQGEFQTLGEYLASLNPHEKRIRNRFTDRKMYEEELDMIWEKQKEYYPNILNENNKSYFMNNIMFFQRPLQSQKSKVGKCTFEPGKKRCAKSHPIAQEFRTLSLLNNLIIIGGPRTIENGELNVNERNKLLSVLSKNKEVTVSTIPTKLKLNKDIDYQFNYDEKSKIHGFKTIIDIRKAIGNDTYNKLKEKDIEDVWNTLNFAEDPDWLTEYSMKKWGLNKEQARKLSKVSLEPGYTNLSLHVMKKMVPYMREGYLYNEAAEKAGYHHSNLDEDVELLEHLPEPPNIRNPIVNTALWQLRGVINSIIDTYGKPDTISIELGRDLKNPLQRRVDIQKNNSKTEEIHNKIKGILEKELNIHNPSRNDILKYKLWEECKYICPFTGKSISLSQLYITGDVDIEHILPYSRTIDNSYNNLTLCFREENEFKSNRTPYEAYSDKPEIYSQIKERIKSFPTRKAAKFIQKKIDLEDFISRQLNDSRYISREAKKYMKHITKDVRVTMGNMTSELRYLWGLNSILPTLNDANNPNDTDEDNRIKNREDHRHHAVDAIVVAFTKRRYLQIASTHRAKMGFAREIPKSKYPTPWEGFRDDAFYAISNIIISRKVKRSPRGTLHKDTHFGLLHDSFGEPLVNHKHEKLFVVRKPLYSLTAKEILNIVDPVIKELVLNRLEENGVDVNKKGFKIPKNAFSEPLFLEGIKTDKRTAVKKVRIKKLSNTMVNIRDYNIWVEPRSNHHMVIYADVNGEINYKTISLYEAAKRKIQGKPIINKELNPGDEFIMSLQRNELLLIGDVPDEFDIDNKSTYNYVFDQIYRVQKMDQNGNIALRQHYVSMTSDYDKRGILRKNYRSLLNDNPRKLFITHHGFLEFADA